MSELTTEQKAELGAKWAAILMLKKSPEHGDRYLTTWGDKTALGIYETVNRLASTNLEDLPQ